MSELPQRHAITSVITLSIKYGSQEATLRIGLFGHLAPVQSNALKQMCLSKRGTGADKQPTQTLKQSTFYRYNEAVGFWLGDPYQAKETPLKEMPQRTEHFQYCISTYSTAADQLSNTFLLVTEKNVDYLNDRHFVIGQLLDYESAELVEKLKKYIVLEPCGRIAEGFEIRIQEVAVDDK